MFVPTTKPENRSQPATAIQSAKVQEGELVSPFFMPLFTQVPGRSAFSEVRTARSADSSDWDKRHAWACR